MEEFVVLTKSGYLGKNKKGQVVCHSTKQSATRYTYEQARSLARSYNGSHMKVEAKS